MNGKQARRLRKLAYQQCNKEDKEGGNYLVQQFKKFKMILGRDGKDKGIEQINQTIRWRPDSFMGIYRRLKKEFKEAKDGT